MIRLNAALVAIMLAGVATAAEPPKLPSLPNGEACFGEIRTVDLIWYTCWCNYMTRIADAFQLPLEKENVFTPPPKK